MIDTTYEINFPPPELIITLLRACPYGEKNVRFSRKLPVYTIPILYT